MGVVAGCLVNGLFKWVNGARSSLLILRERLKEIHKIRLKNLLNNKLKRIFLERMVLQLLFKLSIFDICLNKSLSVMLSQIHKLVMCKE
jgi:hypothetical protein